MKQFRGEIGYAVKETCFLFDHHRLILNCGLSAREKERCLSLSVSTSASIHAVCLLSVVVLIQKCISTI